MKKSKTKKNLALARCRRKRNIKTDKQIVKDLLSYKSYLSSQKYMEDTLTSMKKMSEAEKKLSDEIKKAFDTKGWITLDCSPKEKDDDDDNS